MEENRHEAEGKRPENERNTHAEKNHVPLRQPEISLRNPYQRERTEQE